MAVAMAWRPHLSASENNGNHVAAFACRPNPAPLPSSKVTKGFGRYAFDMMARSIGKVVEVGDEDGLARRNKALAASLELLAVPESRQQCVSAGMVSALAARLGDEQVKSRCRAARCCVSLAGDAAGCRALLETGALAELVALLKDVDDEVRDAAYDALLEAAWDASARQALAEASAGTLTLLLEQAGSEDGGRAERALELLRRAARGGDDKAVKAILDAGGVAQCTAMLAKERGNAVREGAANVLSLACVPFAGKAAALKAGAVPALCAMLGEASAPTSMLAAAAGALMAATVAHPAKAAAVQAGAVGSLVLLLRMHQANERLLLNALQCVTNLAEHTEGRDAMREPQCLSAVEAVRKNTPSSLLERAAAAAMRVIHQRHIGETGA